jgi:hypothetical protein
MMIGQQQMLPRCLGFQLFFFRESTTFSVASTVSNTRFVAATANAYMIDVLAFDV